LFANTSFEVLESKYIPYIANHVVHARHVRTSAELVFIPCDKGGENYFSACFNTPCFNDKGIPHILEHMLLNGSVKYPIPNAYLEVMQRSITSMFGGATWRDRTVYPCSSVSKEDFFNLVEFLLDSVFHPLLEDVSFWQEGYRLDYEKREDVKSKIIHAGVVYNEIKGRENAPEDTIFINIYKSIFPEGSCANFSGGLVEEIPTVTYQEIVEYHKKYYIPSNCLLFVYTSIPFDEITTFLDKRLPKKALQFLKPEKILQSIFERPVRIKRPINSSKESRSIVKSSWLVGNAGNPLENFSLSTLSSILLEYDVSPLRKILMDSGLGKSITPWAFVEDDIQNVFSIGLNGVKREQADEVFNLIQDGLRTCATDQFRPGFLYDVLVSKELQLRKKESYWLFALMDTVCKAWVHGENIFVSLDIDYKFKYLREIISNDPYYFQKLITAKLLNNPHRVDGIFYPDKQYYYGEKLRVESELQLIKERMTAEDRNNLMNQIGQLERYSSSYSREDVIKYIPHLSLEHLPRIKSSFFSKEMLGSDAILITSILSPDLCYLDVCFDISGLPNETVDYMAFFAKYITKTGTAQRTHLEMNKLEISYSGGIQTNLFSIESNLLKTGDYKLVFQIGSYCLPNQLSDFLSLLKERIFHSIFNCVERVLCVSEEIDEQNRHKKNREAKRLSILMSQSGLTASKYYENLFNGIPGYEHIAAINKGSVLNEIKNMMKIYDHIINNAPRTLVWTGPEENIDQIKKWSISLPKIKKVIKTNNYPPIASVPYINTATFDVESAYTSAALHSVSPLHPLASSGAVMMKMLFSFINREIVCKNSAYYVETFLKDGLLTFASIRDPFPSKSIAVFKEAVLNSMKNIDFSKRLIDDAIIYVLKDFYKPVYPSGANKEVIKMHYANKNPSFFNKYLELLLAVDEDSIREFADLQQHSITSLHSCIISSAN